MWFGTGRSERTCWAGGLVWQVPLEQVGGTPIVVGDGAVAVSTGTPVSVFDAADGALLWRRDHGSPGKGGFTSSYSVAGGYSQFWLDETGTVLVGLIVAQQPYRD